MSGTADDPIQPDTSLSSYDTDDDDHFMAGTVESPVEDHPHPRVRIRLTKSYFERDDLMLPACLSKFMPAPETTVSFLRSGREYFAFAYPKGTGRRVRKGWLAFLHATSFQLDDVIDLVLVYRYVGFACFAVINDDPQWEAIAKDFGLPPILFESA